MLLRSQKNTPIDFLIALDTDENIRGCIGMEVYGEDGFVRSFAVQESIRNNGLGAALFERLIEGSLSKGIRNLHLLTTTAETYFQKKGLIPQIQNKKTYPFMSLVRNLLVILYMNW